MKIITAFICILLLFANMATAGQMKDDFLLKEKCGKLAKSIFESEYGAGTTIVDNQTKTSGYESHYNKKMNTCMMLTTTTITGGEIETRASLYDVIENKEYGYLIVRVPNEVIMCWVLNKSCKSFEGWEKLIKPYMSE